MKWKDYGLIYRPDGNVEWRQSHGQLPVIEPLGESRFRVYFAGRTRSQISHIGSFEFDLSNPHKNLSCTAEPLLWPGELGCFDQYGVYPASIVTVDDRKYLYYVGWIRGYESPMFYAAIGLAISEDGGKTFQRYSKAPILSRSKHDPCLVTSPHVFREGDIWRMSYVSGVRWSETQGKLQSHYHIKTAHSDDGIHWMRDGTIAIDFRDEKETNIARPAVLKQQGKYKMWFCYSYDGTPYRMGYAESNDFVVWKRDDQRAGVTVGTAAQNNEMVCYPCVIEHKGKKLMVYNGNSFGKAGVFLAVSSD